MTIAGCSISVPAQQYSQNSNVVTTLVTVPQPPSLALTKQVDKPSAMPGDTLTYTLFYQNTSAQTANQVVIQDQLPAGVSFVSSLNNVQIILGSPPTLRFNLLSSLAGGASGSVQFTVRINSNAPSGSSITNQGTISAAGLSQPQASNPVFTTVTAPPPPVNLGVQKAVDRASAADGDTLTYTLSYANNGGQTVLQVAIVDPLPVGVTFAGSASGGQVNAGAVRFALGDLASGASGSVSFRVTVNAGIPGGTVITNQGRIGGPSVPQAILSNPVSTTVTVEPSVGKPPILELSTLRL